MVREEAHMSIERIDADLCTGCGCCVDSCSTDVIRMDDERCIAVIRYPQDCIICHFCALDCPVDAVTVSPDKSESLTVSWG